MAEKRLKSLGNCNLCGSRDLRIAITENKIVCRRCGHKQEVKCQTQ